MKSKFKPGDKFKYNDLTFTGHNQHFMSGYRGVIFTVIERPADRSDCTYDAEHVAVYYNDTVSGRIEYAWETTIELIPEIVIKHTKEIICKPLEIDIYED